MGVPQLATSNAKQYHGSSSVSTDVMVTDTIHLVDHVIPITSVKDGIMFYQGNKTTWITDFTSPDYLTVGTPITDSL